MWTQGMEEALKCLVLSICNFTPSAATCLSLRRDKLVRPVGLIGKIIWAKLWLLAADHKRSRCIVKNCTKRCRKVTLSKYYY